MASNRRSAGLNRPTHVEPTAVSVLSTATGARLDLIGTVPADAAVSGVSLRAQDIVAGDPVSYTHLTLPTIYSV